MSSLIPSLAAIQKALADFQLSPSTFRILYSISSSGSPRLSSPPPKTLYILDSSFNPPTLAHLDMATSVLHSQQHHYTSSPCASPCRLLLLLATQNADKQLEPASLERRLTMMGFLAGEIARTVGAKGGRKMKSETSSRRWRPPISSDDAARDNDNDLESGDAADSEHYNIDNDNNNNNNNGDDDDAVTVDIGVTKMPYFHDKAAAIAASTVYDAHSPLDGGSGEDTNHQDKMEQVYLVGFDTLIRLLNPKYYPPSRKSLRALDPFFSTSKVRVTRRASETGGGRELQDEYVRALAAGEREGEGGRSEWAQRVQLVGRGEGEEEMISSTKVREAMKRGDEQLMKRLVPDEVGRYILDQGIYCQDENQHMVLGGKGLV